MRTSSYCSQWQGSSTPQGANRIDVLGAWLQENGVQVIDRPFLTSNPGTKSITIHLSNTDDWGIFIDRRRIPDRVTEYSTLLHEGGHVATGATHEVSSPFDLVEKHEYKANKWAVEHAISEEDLDAAVAGGHTEIWDLAEHFDVTEDLMKKAVSWYVYGNLASDLYF
ncbi:MAG: ImmA/IrrE family metallo-endopeptidase [Oscillospiraceae bacterium]|nr:ImmA/IrrE family metallo-endopeptidase [Oscillospiraceae bacterium]